jgi:uncharacterized protein (TIGR02099 family)
MRWAQWCRFCLHKLWLVLAITLVVLATVVTFIRLSLPYAQGYRSDIEQWIHQHYQTNVHIGQLNASWRGGGPSLVLQDVVVHDAKQQRLLRFDETRLRLDFWRSLRQLQWVAADVELSGLHYQLNSADILQSTSKAQTTDTAPILTAIEDLLFRQLQQFTVVDSSLTIQSDYAPDIVVQFKRLRWQNTPDRHQGTGELSVAGITANTVSFILDLHGESLATSKGQLYLQSSELNILPWFEQLLPQSTRLARADVNMQAWADITQGRLSAVQVALAENRLLWRHQGETFNVSIGDGQLRWLPTSDGWRLDSSPLRITTPTAAWHDFRLSIQQLANDDWAGHIEQFRIAAAMPILQLLSQDIPALEQLMAYGLDGRFSAIQWRMQQQRWWLQGDILDLNSRPVRDVPGVQQLNGQFSASADFIQLDIHGKDNTLRWDGAFDRDTPYQQLNAKLLAWPEPDAKRWIIQVPRFALEHPALKLAGGLRLWLGDKPGMRLMAQLRDVPATEAAHYFPLYHMPASVIEYLKPALLGGQVREGTVLWHGNFADFPFNDGNGHFQVLAYVDDAEFMFDPSWPRLTKLNAELLFDNASMQIRSQGADLFGVTVGDGVLVQIPDLFQADELHISVQQAARAEQVSLMLQASALSDSVGAALDYLGVDGRVDANLDLRIGLKQPYARAQGYVDFYANNLQLKQPALAMEQLEGRLWFDNDKIHSDQMIAVSNGIRLQQRFRGASTADGYQLTLQASTEHDVGELLAMIQPQWQTLGQGNAPISATLELLLPQEGFKLDADIYADLTSTELQLPSPFGKMPSDASSINVQIKAEPSQMQLDLTYGEQLTFQARLPQGATQFDAALLSLGPVSRTLEPGFFIDIALAETSVSPWIDLLTELSGETSTDSIMPPLQRVRGAIDNLHLFADAYWPQVQLDMTPTADAWQLALQAPMVEGTLMLGYDVATQGITADIKRMRLEFRDAAALEEAEAERKAERLLDPLNAPPLPDYAALEAEAFAALTPMNWLAQLPPIKLRCDDCTIGHYPLGKVELNARSDGERWQLSNFRSLRQQHRWEFSGYWQQDDGIGVTEINGRLQSPSFGALMHDYDVSSSISGSAADVQIGRLRWQGAPFQFNKHSLDGSISWRFGDGAFTDVSDGGARVFSLLSIDSLVRKLRLDFRDVFAKGFFFNDVVGTVRLDQGVALTNDTRVNGVAGDIDIQGYADLKARQLDYQMSFTPKVTSSLPVILAWMVNPVSGVAALALDQVFDSAEVISKINFEVTGDLDMPEVTETQRDSKKVTLPATVQQPPLRPVVAAPVTSLPVSTVAEPSLPIASDAAPLTTPLPLTPPLPPATDDASAAPKIDAVDE